MDLDEFEPTTKDVLSLMLLSNRAILFIVLATIAQQVLGCFWYPLWSLLIKERPAPAAPTSPQSTPKSKLAAPAKKGETPPVPAKKKGPRISSAVIAGIMLSVLGGGLMNFVLTELIIAFQVVQPVDGAWFGVGLGLVAAGGDFLGTHERRHFKKRLVHAVFTIGSLALNGAAISSNW
eukprot:TRINITY_DN1769_c0_g1_i1.p1 TRINITY_DN1769_c0_g1~~TRINITY_DN1769_c0_g1_i1.p1  ORF type:complete len:188 (+),score=40.45 TRINITY_DN1769_c0_g1_i1:33-566(+)